MTRATVHSTRPPHALVPRMLRSFRLQCGVDYGDITGKRDDAGVRLILARRRDDCSYWTATLRSLGLVRWTKHARLMIRN